MVRRRAFDPMATFDPLAELEGPAMPTVMGAAIEYQAGTELAWHSHEVGQLIYAATGSMTVRTEEGLFIVPPLMAVWVAPAVAHAITMQNRVAMRTLYFRSNALPLPDRRCGVLRVSPLLRELILVRIAESSTERTVGDAVDTLIAHEMQTANFEPLILRAPNDRRVRRIVTALLEQPTDPRSLSDWSRTVGASPRTIERIFLRETHLTFRQWRQRARLLQAVLYLAEGRSVTTVAFDVGYASQSAFTYMFRCALGVAPRHYFRKAG
jgi:AraC-like DNA-binding protein